MTKNHCKICELLGERKVPEDHGLSHPQNSSIDYANYGLLNGLYLPQLKDMMLAAYLLRGYYQPAGPLIQHPPTLPPIKGPPPEPTPTPPQNSESSDDLVATSTTSGGTNSTGNSSWRSYRKPESRIPGSAIPSTSIVPTGGGFYRAYCPQYYGTPPQYQELCYPPTYPHPHPHPPPYYKYAPAYRRQYYSYPEAGGGGGAGGASSGAPGVVEYQPPPPPGEYSIPPYYAGYPPPPAPPPPPPNPAYLHAQGRPIVDPFQGCPCPMQSCPKNVDTGPLIGNGKGAPVASGPGLSLPPSALVGPPSPARGLAGLAPPHGANAWDTDRVQINTHHQQNSPSKHPKCACEKLSCTSTCEVKIETLSPAEASVPSPSLVPQSPSSLQQPQALSLQKLASISPQLSNMRTFKTENNNVKCESCSVGIVSDTSALSCVSNCNVKCEQQDDYKCGIIKCEQCLKEDREMAILEIDKDSGILMIDDKLDAAEAEVKEEISDVVVVNIDSESWTKPDYEDTVSETIEDDTDNKSESDITRREILITSKCQKLTKRKLSLDSLSSLSPKKIKLDKRTLSVGSGRDINDHRVPNPMNEEYLINRTNFGDSAALGGDFGNVGGEIGPLGVKKKVKKENFKRKAEEGNIAESNSKKVKKSVSTCPVKTASAMSIMETINNVIQQSVQMTSRTDDDDINIVSTCNDSSNSDSINISNVIVNSGKKERDSKRKSGNLLSIIKNVPKKADKLGFKDCKLIDKDKGGKEGKGRVKKMMVKNKVLEDKGKVEVKSAGGKGRIVKIQDKEDKEEKKPAALVKKKSNKKSTNTKKICGKKIPGRDESVGGVLDSFSSLTKKSFLKPKWSNGWSWEGDSYEAKVYLTNEESAIRRCYKSMKHVSGDVLRPRDCVLLKSGPRKADLPFVAKIAALWENPDDGEMMFSLLWYYRPEHTEQGRTDFDTEDEVFASRHRDANSVACIEDKCYILTFNEYCRYRKNLRRIEENLDCPGLIVPPGEQSYPRESRQPPIPVPSDMVLFCRRVYDYRGKKLVKNPG
ncbi:GSCOCG00002751001-RA-CDS [Cotesia congregata]|nr:GSCOCG00002751001-RA-CDS [Cotesia congregata]